MLWRNHSNETSLAIRLHDTIWFSIIYEGKSGIFFEFLQQVLHKVHGKSKYSWTEWRFLGVAEVATTWVDIKQKCTKHYTDTTTQKLMKNSFHSTKKYLTKYCWTHLLSLKSSYWGVDCVVPENIYTLPWKVFLVWASVPFFSLPFPLKTFAFETHSSSEFPITGGMIFSETTLFPRLNKFNEIRYSFC